MNKVASHTILALSLTILLISCNNCTFSPNKAWVVTTLAGKGTEGNDNGNALEAEFNRPYGVAVDSSGNVYVADMGNNSIRRIDTDETVSTLAGTVNAGFWDSNLPGTVMKFKMPIGVAVDSAGNLYVAEKDNHRIRKITLDSTEPNRVVVSTLAGTSSGFKNGARAEAQFKFPYGVAVDRVGNVYVADTENHRIRKITTDSSCAVNVITLAGSDEAGLGNSDDPKVKFNEPKGVAVDQAGNVYVGDRLNHRIRKITTDSSGAVNVITLAGSSYGYTNAIIGTEAQFRFPHGVAVDSAGNVYVADSGNNCIRKITILDPNKPNEVAVSTLAGSGKADYEDGIAKLAQFKDPTGVALDSDGNIYVADHGNHRIRKIEYRVP